MRFRSQLELFLLAAALTAALGAAPAPRLAIRAQVTVHDEQVTLADLLTVPAAPALERQAEQTILSAAPRPGMVRNWRRIDVAGALERNGWVAAEFAIPEQVILTRAGQPLDRAAVTQAVMQLLRQRANWRGPDPGADDVTFAAPWVAAGDAARITAMAAAWDAPHGRWDVVCQAVAGDGATAGTPTFHVFVQPPSGDLGAGAYRRVENAAATAVTGAAASPILVRANHVAQLTIQNSGYALTGKVMPLRDGRAGEQIGAVNLATRAVLQVYVTGENAVGNRPPATSPAEGTPDVH